MRIYPFCDRRFPTLIYALRGAHRAYEPLRVEQPDGAVGVSSFPNLTPGELEIGVRLWHMWCFVDRQAELDG
jgi:hypothetical protein